MDINYFEQLWVKRSDNERSYKEVNPNCWDNRAQEFNQNRTDERINKITELLVQKGMLTADSTVLDIGCGPGKFVLEFAKTAQKVVGLDSAPKMIQAARENAAAKGATNVEFRELDWMEADLSALKWKKKFSLVTAIMSPAINNKLSLDKMINASSEYCLICHFLERYDSVGDELQIHIFGQKRQDDYGNKGLFCSFNIVWLYKFFPEIFYIDTDREIRRTVEEAYQHYVNRFGIRRTLTATEKEEMKNFLISKAENGIVKERVKAKIGCVCWKNN